MKRDLITLLEMASADSVRRPNLISAFQKVVFEGTADGLGLTQSEWDVFTQLAQDLDYYEPDPALRDQDPSFYGDDKVVMEISSVLKGLSDEPNKIE